MDHDTRIGEYRKHVERRNSVIAESMSCGLEAEKRMIAQIQIEDEPLGTISVLDNRPDSFTTRRKTIALVTSWVF